MPFSAHPFIILNSVDSTNNYAMAQVHAGLATHGSSYFAFQQTGGKGQRGRTWSTGASENIALSIVIQPESLVLSDQFYLIAAVSLGCYDLVKNLAGEDTRIKWPNDIYWRDRKAGGILIENLVQADQWRYAIVGIGLNVNQAAFPGFTTKAVSIRQITGKNNNILEMAGQLWGMVQKRYQELQIDKKKLIHDYNSVLYKRDETVKLRVGNVVFASVVRGVSALGRLIVSNGIEQELEWGAVEWIRENDE